jgi:epoxide hydrolase 4
MSSPASCIGICPPTKPDPLGRPAEHRFVSGNGLRFHLVEQGAGPLVLLLHGFPELWYSWRAQLPALAERTRAVAVDLRGYNLTEPAPERGAQRYPYGYALPRLVADAAALIEALGTERARVVGHDWGGLIAWLLASWRPDLVERLAIVNAPHPGAYLRELRRNGRQRLASWYVVWFQVPWLPERLLGRDGARPVAELLQRTTVRPDAFTPADLAVYRRAFSRPGALRAALGYYRALGRTDPRKLLRSLRPIRAPTLLIWGEQDVALMPELSQELTAWVPDLRVARLPEAGHWVHQEQPEQVNQALIEFLAPGPGRERSAR